MTGITVVGNVHFVVDFLMGQNIVDVGLKGRVYIVEINIREAIKVKTGHGVVREVRSREDISDRGDSLEGGVGSMSAIGI